MLTLRARSADANIAGIGVRDGSMLFENGGTTTSLVANVAVPGADVSAAGNVELTKSGITGGHLEAFSPRVDIAALGALGAPLHGGSAVGFATLDGPMSDPRMRAAAALRSSYENAPLEGDLDLRYDGATLRSNASRVAFAGSRATVNGSIAHLTSGESARALSLDVSVRHGDLAGFNRITGERAPLTGSFAADVRVDGDQAAPRVAGDIATAVGTIRGVTFDDLSGRMRASTVRSRSAAARCSSAARASRSMASSRPERSRCGRCAPTRRHDRLQRLLRRC